VEVKLHSLFPSPWFSLQHPYNQRLIDTYKAKIGSEKRCVCVCVRVCMYVWMYVEAQPKAE
jgi:hypothetical protein